MQIRGATDVCECEAGGEQVLGCSEGGVQSFEVGSCPVPQKPEYFGRLLDPAKRIAEVRNAEANAIGLPEQPLQDTRMFRRETGEAIGFRSQVEQDRIRLAERLPLIDKNRYLAKPARSLKGGGSARARFAEINPFVGVRDGGEQQVRPDLVGMTGVRATKEVHL